MADSIFQWIKTNVWVDLVAFLDTDTGLWPLVVGVEPMICMYSKIGCGLSKW